MQLAANSGFTLWYFDRARKWQNGKQKFHTSEEALR